MNDPHVEALIYRVEHGPAVDYDKATPLVHDASAFTVRVEDGRARFQMKAHFESADAARAEVEPFIQAWQIIAGLDQGPDGFGLAFETAEVIDRDPKLGVVNVSGACEISFASKVTLHISHSHFPEPVHGLKVSPEVKQMYRCYMLYQDGKDRLGTVAQLCLGVLEESTGKSRGRRRKAADTYSISIRVLNKLGCLCDKKGGEKEGRKASATHEEFTDQEKAWVIATIKALIRRAAEVAYDPSQKLPQISLSDLPPLSPPSCPSA